MLITDHVHSLLPTADIERSGPQLTDLPDKFPEDGREVELSSRHGWAEFTIHDTLMMNTAECFTD